MSLELAHVPLPEAIPFPYYVNLYAIRSRSVASLSWEINILEGSWGESNAYKAYISGTLYGLLLLEPLEHFIIL